MSTWSEPRPGTVYRWLENKLYLFEPKRIFVITGGPDPPRSWKKTAKRGWRAARPPISSFVWSDVNTDAYSDCWCDRQGQRYLPFIERLRGASLGHRGERAWAKTFPRQVRGALAMYEGVDRSWHLLSLGTRCPGAIDLMHSTRVLGYCLASNWVFLGERRVSNPLRLARSLLRRRQREIASRLGFPGTDSAVKMLRRVSCSCIQIAPLLYLRNAMNDPDAAALLRHLPSINRDIIRLASDAQYRAHVTPRLMLECSGQGDRFQVARTMRDTLAMLRGLAVDTEAVRFRSIAHLERLHAEVIERVNRRWPVFEAPVVIPPPPLPGGAAASIQPLTSPEDLTEEGRLQENCVAIYARFVSDSVGPDGCPELYVYRVLSPERATLAIVRRNRRWIIDELKAKHNVPVRAETRRAVEDWLDSVQSEDDQTAGSSLDDWAEIAHAEPCVPF